ncbi:MAG: transcription antitermination factor NusB, partial [Leptospiraceae bacterium]|nr:transcription antitermination factor NusB [Leptospiraceae bacterium]
MKPHRARILAMQATFQKEFHGRSEDELMKFDWIDFTPDEAELNFARRIISGTFEHQQEIDAAIVNHSKNWDFDRISPVS